MAIDSDYSSKWTNPNARKGYTFPADPLDPLKFRPQGPPTITFGDDYHGQIVMENFFFDGTPPSREYDVWVAPKNCCFLSKEDGQADRIDINTVYEFAEQVCRAMKAKGIEGEDISRSQERRIAKLREQLAEQNELEVGNSLIKDN